MNAVKWMLAAGLVLPAAYQQQHAPLAAPVPAPRPAPPQALRALAPAAQVVAPTPYAVELAVQKARTEGAGENEVYRLRAAALSARVIAELTEREQAEKQWLQRLQAWRAEGAQQAQREQLFSAEEQTRLDAYAPAVPVLK